MGGPRAAFRSWDRVSCPRGGSDGAYANRRPAAFMTRMSEQAADVIPIGEAVEASIGFEEFFRAERARLYRALLLVTHSATEADEIVQEAFCRVWERWDRVRTFESPVGYLYRTAMNVHRSAYRRTLRAAMRAFGATDVPDPFEAVASQDEAVRALANLTPRQRAAVVLTELLGYTSDDAGAILRIRGGSVRALVSQAKARLAEIGGDDE